MGYSRNALGEFGEDGIQRDAQGNVVPVGVDEKAKAEYQRLIDGPKYITRPSERDIFFAAGGTLKEHDYTIADSTPSGGQADMEAQEKAANAPDIASGITAGDKPEVKTDPKGSK